MTLHTLTITRAHDLLKAKTISSVELTQAVLDHIARMEPQVRAYLTVTPEHALAQAQAADTAIARGEVSPLTGIPLAIKDVICTHGIRTTCGSKILGNFVPPYDAFVMQQLNKMGAVMVGKLNMDEFAMGSTTEHSAFHPTSNPWNLAHIPGGSSGGSAAAVSADMCLAALGSDTGGSIRQPASHCGVVGLKPTYGRVSRFGLVAFASSLDQIGPLGKTVADCALLLQAVAGHDRADATCAPHSVPDYSVALGQTVKGLKIGIPQAHFESPGLDPKVADTVMRAVKVLEELGARTVAVELPHTQYGVAAYYVIAPCEASSNLARYDGVKYGLRDSAADQLLDMYHNTRSEGFGAEVQRRVLIGTYALSAGYYDAYYRKASQVRTLIMRDFQEAFAQCDLIASPVTPTPAPAIGAHSNDPLAMYMSDVYTLPANLAGIPGISVPCGLSADGLPIGLQLMASHFQEEKLLTVAHHFEQATEFHKARPPL
ncbi:MAG: Asp-tRNA(Asn)/Glu-tRNA(Gln) amidotransferase subunit GatA [Desulfatitalea sp.]|nr:Asp-tRNA(Asn)/Glu-tRNA(Gln) amidotransferase subunit GatA [Desulfatitalea sp.]NNJ99755.1 Asp-tRNA(Asn)/Glu-tRNA(Gln) amidotransferase subunit GatA [Desulfatitalea sp.]